MQDYYTVARTFVELPIGKAFKVDEQIYIKRSNSSAHTPYATRIQKFTPTTTVKVHSLSKD
jgi:hypothetical protein